MCRSRDLPTAARASRRGRSFFACRALSSTGTSSPPDAVRRGAAALVCERPLGTDVPEVVVPSVRAAMGPLAAAFHGQPTAQLRVVGVTGTNGKTTTAFLARHVLEAAGHPDRACWARSTRSSAAGSRRSSAPLPRRSTCRRRSRACSTAGDEACVMEVSSHALELHRAAGIEFDCAVFTNLTQDHLDFHGTLDDYYAAKRKLFLPAGGAPADGRRRERRRRMGTTPRRRDRPTGRSRHLRRGPGRRLPRPRRPLRLGGLVVRVLDRGGRRRGAGPAARSVQRLQRARGDRRGAARWACHRTRPRPRSQNAAPRARPLRAGRRGPGLRRAGGLRAHAGLARERAGRPRASCSSRRAARAG